MLRPTGFVRACARGVFALAAAVAAALALFAGLQLKAETQAWPQRNVRLILPFGAGTATDAAARLLGDRLSASWGGNVVVVENRPGGDGLVAIGAFVSAGDDHVLLYASSASFIAHPYQHDKLPYDLEDRKSTRLNSSHLGI